jgi:hypothetical protein
MLYDAFNERDIATVLAALTEDVDWPNAWEGGRLHGRDEVRSYWRRQWAEIDPEVKPLAITREDDGRYAVEVDQTVLDLDGRFVSRGRVRHVYELRGDLVARMDVEEEPDRTAIARAMYGAYESGDRSVAERHLSDDLVFSSPADVGIDRATYFERCWPNAGNIDAYSFERLFEHGDEVVVTYEATRTDGTRFRNTEVLTFSGDQISRVEVYFGWNLE